MNTLALWWIKVTFKGAFYLSDLCVYLERNVHLTMNWGMCRNANTLGLKKTPHYLSQRIETCSQNEGEYVWMVSFVSDEKKNLRLDKLREKMFSSFTNRSSVVFFLLWSTKGDLRQNVLKQLLHRNKMEGDLEWQGPKKD